MNEIWKPVKVYPFRKDDYLGDNTKHPYPYEVSNLGNVRTDNEKILYPSVSRRGYRTIGLFYRDMVRFRIKVARLVAGTFIRPIQLGEEVHHINEDTSDDRVENLEILTRGEHMRRRRYENPEEDEARKLKLIELSKDLKLEPLIPRTKSHKNLIPLTRGKLRYDDK